MAAFTETSSVVTEFSGQYKVAAIELDGVTGTTNTVTIDEFSTVVNVMAKLKEAPTAACAYVYAAPNATTATNVLSVVLYKSDLVNTCTQTATDIYLQVIGY